ncbi:MAG: hypothetical protein J6Z33_00280 [Lachnospiraceae bacterium]|nr:hypothetical protein [Lachnospiraceae bacterium]
MGKKFGTLVMVVMLLLLCGCGSCGGSSSQKQKLAEGEHASDEQRTDQHAQSTALVPEVLEQSGRDVYLPREEATTPSGEAGLGETGTPAGEGSDDGTKTPSEEESREVASQPTEEGETPIASGEPGETPSPGTSAALEGQSTPLPSASATPSASAPPAASATPAPKTTPAPSASATPAPTPVPGASTSAPVNTTAPTSTPTNTSAPSSVPANTTAPTSAPADPCANGHVYDEGYVWQASTCTTPGDYCWHCTVCGREKHQTMPLAEHNLSKTLVREGDCLEPDEYRIDCSECDYFLIEEDYSQCENRHHYVTATYQVFDEELLEWVDVTRTYCSKCNKNKE